MAVAAVAAARRAAALRSVVRFSCPWMSKSVIDDSAGTPNDIGAFLPCTCNSNSHTNRCDSPKSVRTDVAPNIASDCTGVIGLGDLRKGSLRCSRSTTRSKWQ